MRKPSSPPPSPPSDPLKWFVFFIFDGVTETKDSLKYVRATSTVKHITPVMVQFYSPSVLITFSTDFKSVKSSEIKNGND